MWTPKYNRKVTKKYKIDVHELAPTIKYAARLPIVCRHEKGDSRFGGALLQLNTLLFTAQQSLDK